MKDIKQLIIDLLNILDSFDRSLSVLTPEENPNVIAGILLIKKQFIDTLSNYDVSLVDCNIPFDPNIHDAISIEKHNSFANNHIIKVIKNGYYYKGKLLRPAQVIVVQN